jgi:NodT family efflux transporter outer membrane factor (OMF) lipoprotein
MHSLRQMIHLTLHNARVLSPQLGLAAVLLLAACNVGDITPHAPSVPDHWSNAAKAPLVDDHALKEWWKQFNDPSLNWLVEATLKNSPDVGIAATRIAEARGISRTADAALLPKVDATGDASRSKQALFVPIVGTNYDAGFDASYELDLFGKNRTAAQAADAATRAATLDYDWVKLSMIAEVTRSYIAMRAAEKQITLAQKNLTIEKDTQGLVAHQQQAGGTSEFDVERTKVEVHQSAARIAEYKRQREANLLALVTLTGLTANEIRPHMVVVNDIPGIELTAVASAPAAVLNHRPDIEAANARLAQATSLKQSQAAAIFPDISLSGMFGLTRNAFVTTTTGVWSYGANAAVNILDFGRIQGQIDAASAREQAAYETWRKSILQAMQDVETALSNVSRISEQRAALAHARENADRSLALARVRYKAGDSSLLDALDAQRQLIAADSALVDAEANYVTAIIALYKALGQY